MFRNFIFNNLFINPKLTKPMQVPSTSTTNAKFNTTTISTELNKLGSSYPFNGIRHYSCGDDDDDYGHSSGHSSHDNDSTPSSTYNNGTILDPLNPLSPFNPSHFNDDDDEGVQHTKDPKDQKKQTTTVKLFGRYTNLLPKEVVEALKKDETKFTF